MAGRGRIRGRSELSAAQVVNQAIFLGAIWLGLSGKFDLFHLLLGLLSVLLVLGFNDAIRRLKPARGGPASRDRLNLVLALLYVPWLVWQIISSAVYVTRLILAPPSRLDPRILRFRCDQPNEVAEVVLGNSITLTPGTLTLDIHDDEFVIHCLDQGVADGVLAGTMQRRVARLWGGDGAVTEPRIEAGEDIPGAPRGEP
jgi:multicomponent Na+:H+ antiporter subunit E